MQAEHIHNFTNNYLFDQATHSQEITNIYNLDILSNAASANENTPSFTLTDAVNCIVTGPDGSKFREPSCAFPILEYLYFPFEKYHINDGRYLFDYFPIKHYLETHVFLPVLAVTLYAGFLYYGKKYFAHRKPLNLRWIMAGWNLFLAVYSMLTVFHALPAVTVIAKRSFHDNLCKNPETHFGGSAELWVILFVLSKFAELFDTFFIIVHKKPLIFLHWYHHITVLLFCWVAFQEKTPSTIFFGPINACIHSIMYFYYFLMAIKMKPKWFNAIWLTVGQIVQMVVGTTMSLMSMYYYMTDDSCSLKKGSLVASFFLYGSYLYLFSAFFIERYFKGNKNATFAGEKVDKKYL